MRHYNSETERHWYLNEIICDQCKQKLTKEELDYGMWHTIEYYGGYGSEWPGDLKKATADVCESCLQGLIGNFAIIENTD